MSFIRLITRPYGIRHQLISLRHTGEYAKATGSCIRQRQTSSRSFHHNDKAINPKKDAYESPKTLQDESSHSTVEIRSPLKWSKMSDLTNSEAMIDLKRQWLNFKFFWDGRFYPDAPITKKKHGWVIWTLLGVNGGVWLAFEYAFKTYEDTKDEMLLAFMNQNFRFNTELFRQGRVWIVFTSCMAHKERQHLVVNMFVLYYIAPPLIALLGPTRFLLLYFGSSVVSDLGHFTLRHLQQRYYHAMERDIIGPQRGSMTQNSSLGASGSIYAYQTTFALVAPFTTFRLYYWIPTPLWLITGCMYVNECSNAWEDPIGKTGPGAHFGGILAGILFWRFGLRGVRYRSLF